MGRALAFIREAFPGTFEGKPEGTSGSWTRFRIEDEHGFPIRFVYVHATGLVEVQWALSVPEGAISGPPNLPNLPRSE